MLYNPKPSTRLFPFTEAENRAIERACRKAEQWMTEKYGKGRKPYNFGIGDR